MPFAESKRVIFSKNPLEEVVSQLRFPPILRIDVDAEALAALQERVRRVFPLYERRAAQARIPAALLPLPAELLRAFSDTVTTTHEFATPDKLWKLSLTRDSIALTTTAYREWGDFRAKLEGPIAALCATYEPAFFTRVGLRYRDRIDRERFGLSDVEWRSLLLPEALGELGDPKIGPHVRQAVRELVVELSEGAGRVRVVHGLETDAGKNQTYVFDADFFTEGQTDTKVVTHALDAFNRRAGNLFRWYLTDRLRNAMEPRDPG